MMKMRMIVCNDNSWKFLYIFYMYMKGFIFFCVYGCAIVVQLTEVARVRVWCNMERVLAYTYPDYYRVFTVSSLKSGGLDLYVK